MKLTEAWQSLSNAKPEFPTLRISFRGSAPAGTEVCTSPAPAKQSPLSAPRLAGNPTLQGTDRGAGSSKASPDPTSFFPPPKAATNCRIPPHKPPLPSKTSTTPQSPREAPDARTSGPTTRRDPDDYPPPTYRESSRLGPADPPHGSSGQWVEAGWHKGRRPRIAGPGVEGCLEGGIEGGDQGKRERRAGRGTAESGSL